MRNCFRPLTLSHAVDQGHKIIGRVVQEGQIDYSFPLRRVVAIFKSAKGINCHYLRQVRVNLGLEVINLPVTKEKTNEFSLTKN